MTAQFTEADVGRWYSLATRPEVLGRLAEAAIQAGSPEDDGTPRFLLVTFDGSFPLRGPADAVPVPETDLVCGAVALLEFRFDVPKPPGWEKNGGRDQIALAAVNAKWLNASARGQSPAGLKPFLQRVAVVDVRRGRPAEPIRSVHCPFCLTPICALDDPEATHDCPGCGAGVLVAAGKVTIYPKGGE